jgi:ABC-type oligopeptide transport system substrate-binding subunit
MKLFKRTVFCLLLVLLVVALALTGCGGGSGSGERDNDENNGGSGNGEIPQNLKPTAVDDSDTTDHDKPITIDVLANDISSGGDLRITGVSKPEKGQVEIDNNKITYTPEDTGVFSFTYHIADDNGTAAATVTVTVILGLGDLPIRGR